MNWWQALVLGVIEGITEYLPVSSTGHLIVAQRMMGIGTSPEDKAAADCFAICIQGGAIAAVLGLYWPRVRQMFLGLLGKNPEGLKLIFAIIAGFLPAAVIGLLANDWIEEKLFHFKWIAWAWFVGGIGILVVDRWMKKGGGSQGRELAEITIKMAFLVGLMQCVAMWPGTSRSLMTIIGGILVGLRLSAAVEFSFLLGLATLGAATAKKAVWPIEGLAAKYDTAFGGALLMWDRYGLVPLAIGVIAATVSAAVAVKWMVAYLNRRGLGVFGWYRIAAAIAAAAMIATNFLGLAHS
ncbi:undecaprenyl-diphosphate phosphatase [Luteolibacter sp. GHJ8]|jgi:undecaprenyl-diphosphatase|uniref:Undecaprenyl-diphosphatase n=1 Tax=Luteolibacter rhizosphaerae TaxID=2989719 RepID=A0ABT3FYF7_9BACT|nr:undecaprenyl-diphosphate phosphatase [Luteolibacter rhizosphaerae]MCW1912611.1 undecaprenyl-diphosphate phosphatase [Luteolibacter rhizosphaerae]